MASVPSCEEDVARGAEAFCVPNDALSIAAVVFDYALYLSAVAVAILGEGFFLKLLGVIIAGTAISMLFILGHDAAHKSLVTGRRLNAALGRILFLPCLHNYTLWVIQHNRLHHQFTNVRGLNSYSPLTIDEFQNMPLWRRLRERGYRSLFGFGAYYLVERWWRDKFFPRRDISAALRKKAWLDFALLCAWALIFATGLGIVGASAGRAFSSLIWGFAAPYLVWNQLMGLTAFLQHTHPLVPWFRTKEDAKAARPQAERTVLVEFPRWYDLLSHNIMQHQAHHISPRIPWFRLRRAQMLLTPMLGPKAIVDKMGLRYVLRLTKICQLYDYDSNRWLTYTGKESARPDSDFLRPLELRPGL